MVNLVAVQMTSSPDVDENFAAIEEQLKTLSSGEQSLVVLPECFACFGGSDRRQLELAEVYGDGPIQRRLQALARQYGCYLVGGTIPLKSTNDDKFTASSLLFAPDGSCLAEYQKIHLFDVSVADSTKTYLESRYTDAGDKVVVVETELGKIGMAVCYDVRFPGLFDAMGDIDILVLPAAFTQRTGAAHWHTLVRARAIEKQSFVVAAGQWGTHKNGRETFGHSIIYSPWGDVLAEREAQVGITQASADVASITQIRDAMPLAQHNRFRSHFVKLS